MQKKMFSILLFACAVIVISALNVSAVRAGDINAAESSIMAFANGTFTYEGRTYRATSSAIGNAYMKLASDGVDLTQAQADSLISQASANVKAGIDGGYLVPVDEESKQGDTAEGNGGSKGKDSEEQDGEGKKELQYSEELQTIDINALLENQAQGNQKNLKLYMDSSDVSDKSVKDLFSSDPNDVLTAEQYVDGNITVSSFDGKLVFTGSLPVRNTGFDLSGSAITLVVTGVVLVLTLILAAFCIVSKKRAQ